MNKLFTKIAASVLGLSMATGVGVAVASNQPKAEPAQAASATWNKITSNPVSGTEYLILSSDGTKYFDASVATIDSTSNPVAITVSNNSVTGDYDGKAWTFTKSGDNWYISRTLNNTTTYIGRTANSNGITTGSSGIANTITNSSGAFTIKGTGSGSSKQMSYNSSSGRFRYFASGTVLLYEKAATTQTITVDPASKEAYTDESISLTTNATSASWALSNNTCGATLSAASGKTVSVSATSAGSVRVTATASGYTSPYVDLTFNEKPTSPFITPEKNSSSGYTGQNESISFSYGNLTGSLSITSSNTSVVTVGTPSYSAGEGTVQFNFVGAGSTTVKFKDGSTELASVSVNVTASSVTISGLPASKDVYIGKTIDLGSLITVTATGSYSSDVTWESDDDSIAEVSAAGVVTGVSEGDVDITVTSDDYPSATMTCTVSVSEAPLQYEVVFGTNEGTTGITDFSNTTIVCPSEVTLDNITGNVYGSTTNAQVCLRFGKSGTTGSFDASISGNYYIVSVTCNLKYYGSDTTATFAVTPNGGSAISKSLTGSWADYTYDVSEAQAKKVTLGTDVNGKRAYLSGFTITYAALKTLSSITLSGLYPTSFTKGDTFSHSGMVVTANYSDSTSAVVTNSATWSSPDMSTTGSKTITVSYSDAYGSASETYSISVNYAAPTSVTLSSNSGTVALEEAFNLSTISVTINPSATADQTAYAWSLYDDGDLVEDSDYVWISPEIMSYTAGTFVFRCTSTEDGTKYAEFTLTVSGDPIAHLKDDGDNDVTNGSATVFADAGSIYYSVAAENFQGTLTYTWSSSNSSIISVDDELDDMCGFYVEGVAGSARLSCRIQGSVKGDVTVYIDVTVSAVSVTSVTWSAPTIDVFSGATLTASDTSSWNVRYSTDSGKTDQTPDSFSVKLGGSTISLPYTWTAADDGKTLCVEVGGVSSAATTVTVTQTINAVNAPVSGDESTSTLTFTAACGGSGTADDSKAWTVTSDGTESTFDSTKGIHYGTGSAAVQYINLTSSDFTTGKITKVVVNASTASGVSATVAVNVGGSAFGGAAQSLSSSAAEYTFNGEVDADEIEVVVTKPSSATKAIYCKSIAVTYVEESGETVNIANVAAHKDAQRVAVKYANAFNAAMDETNGCTTGIAAAWSACSDAYDTFKSEAAALGSAEEAYAKNLIKYATAQYRDPESEDNGNDCIERMMKTYEIMVGRGQTEFMSELVSLSNNLPLSVVNNDNLIIVVTIIALVSITAVGGYFFLKKKKEQ